VSLQKIIILRETIGRRDVWIWGAKTTGIEVYSLIVRLCGITPAGFIDGNPRRQGQTCCNRKIVSPEEFLTLYKSPPHNIQETRRAYQKGYL
jgi:hypothetical protein